MDLKTPLVDGFQERIFDIGHTYERSPVQPSAYSATNTPG